MGRQHSRRARSCGAIMAATLAVSGCVQGPAYVMPTFSFLSSYKASSTQGAVLLDNSAWWRGLNDPALDRLVSLALVENLTLALARERVTQAQAALQAVPGAGLVNGSVATQLAGSNGGGDGVQVPSRIGLTWVLDPWGARRNELRAAGADVEAADAKADAAQLLVLLNLGNAYADLRYRQRLLILARQDLGRSERTLGLTRTQLAARSATRLDVTRAEARVAEIRSQLPGLAAACAGRINEIAVLVGQAPGRLPADLARALTTVKPQPVAGMAADVGIPADLLRNRPDIRIAERRYYAAVARIGVAEAAQYPTLSLTGLITVDGIGNSNNSEYYFGPSLQLPALSPATAKARIAQRHSLARSAYTEWKSTVLSAILEVENALATQAATQAALGAAARAARLYREAEQLTADLVDQNEGTFADLIDAQQDVAASERSLAGLRFEQAQNFVTVNVQLGAGHRARPVPSAQNTGRIVAAKD